MRGLLVIDDVPLRKASFSAAEKIIKKIDRLEGNIAAFHDTDQKLFNDWWALTFRSSQSQIEDLHEKLKGLSQFHNWIIAVSRQLDIEMPRAYRLLRMEQENYAHGDAEQRQRIEEARRDRDRFIREEMEREFREHYGDEDFDDDDEDAEFDGGDDSPPPRTPDEEELFDYLNSLSDKRIRQICQHHDEAMETLSFALGLGRKVEDYKLFLRIWEQAPHKLQQRFAKSFSKGTGVSLQTVIERMRQALAEVENESASHSEDDEEMDEDPFTDDFIGSGARHSTSTHLPPVDLEKLKLIYRKLVRRLHPDLQDTHIHAKQILWQRKIWDRAQTAHRNQSLEELERLYKLTLLRQKELHDLTIGEIRESCHWLSGEQERLQNETNGLKRLPAWGFSRAKSHATLQKRLQKDFDRQAQQLEEEIGRLESQHEFLEFLSQQTDRPAPRKRKSRRSSPRSPRRRRSSSGPFR